MGDEDATRINTLSVFTDWARGAYGSEPDTDAFIICPWRANGNVRLMDFLVEL